MTRQWGRAYQWVGAYLDLRDGHKCFFCGKSDIALIVEHLDRNPTNYDPGNLHWSCWSCNQKKELFPKPLPQERENEGPAHGEWSSEEGARSDRMTYRYRQELYHPKNGRMKDQGTRFGKTALAEWLEEWTGVGKSTTYLKYLSKDITAGYLNQFEEDGMLKLERTEKPYPLERLGMKDA